VINVLTYLEIPAQYQNALSAGALAGLALVLLEVIRRGHAKRLHMMMAVVMGICFAAFLLNFPWHGLDSWTLTGLIMSAIIGCVLAVIVMTAICTAISSTMTQSANGRIRQP